MYQHLQAGWICSYVQAKQQLMWRHQLLLPKYINVTTAKRNWNIQFHWFWKLVMPVHSIKVHIPATRGLILVTSFSSRCFGDYSYATNQVNCRLVSVETLDAFVLVQKGEYCQSGCTILSTKQVRKRTDLVQLELVNQLSSCYISSPH